MIDDPQDEALRTLAADYHQPPPVRMRQLRSEFPCDSSGSKNPPQKLMRTHNVFHQQFDD